MLRYLPVTSLIFCINSTALAQSATRPGQAVVPPPPMPPPIGNPVSPRPWSSGRTTAPSFGAGLPLRRSVFVPNVSFEMNFHSNQNVDCPAYFTAVDEASASGFSKHFAVYNGEAPLRWFSSSIKVVFKNENRAVWRGQLRPEFVSCHAEAAMSSWSSRSLKPKQGHLFLRLHDGTATLTADYLDSRTLFLATRVYQTRAVRRGPGQFGRRKLLI